MMIFHPPLRLISVSLLHFTLRRCNSPFCNHLSHIREGQTRPNNPSKSLIPKNPVDKENHVFLHLLRLCDNIESLKKIHTLFILHGLMKNESLVVEILRTCFHLNIPEYALSVLHTFQNPTLFLQNSILRHLSDHGLYDDLLHVYVKLQNIGCGYDNFTFPFVIKACTAISVLQLGKEVHAVVFRTGFEHNVVIQTALVDMYAKSGDMKTSCQVFDKISQRDLISWNALLSGYSWNGLDQEAFDVFHQIRIMGLSPNASTFVNIISACERLGRQGIGKSVHGFAVKCGILLDEYLVPAMISMYASCEDLSTARSLFLLLAEKSIVAWNAMISAYTQNRKFNEAFEIFQQMHKADKRPDLVTLVSILPFCADLCSVRFGESVHLCSIKQGLEHQISVASALVTMYAKLGDLASAEFLFDSMPEKNLLSWNSMASGYFQNGLFDLGLAAFQEMQFAGVRPDTVSIVSVLSATAKLGDLLLGKSVHAFSIRCGFDSNLNVSNAALAMYSVCNQLFTSLRLFDKMPVKNIISWNSVISGCVRCDSTEIAVALLREMQQKNFKFDLITLISILPMHSQAESMVQGMSIHCHAIKVGYDHDVSLVNALISMYVNCGDLEAGHLLFECTAIKNVITWNALITGYRNCNLFREVMSLFQQMKREDQKPNSVTLLSILPVCQSQLQGKSIHAYSIRSGCIIESPLITSLICMYDRFENVKACCLLFKKGDKRNVVLWNAMISVHVESKHAENAVLCFWEMLYMEVKPDSVTILNLVSACVQLSSLDFAQCVMAYVIHKGFQNDIFVCNALIDMYFRCGSILTAKKIFDGMDEKDAVSWSVMINGYGMHGDGDHALALLSQMKCNGFEPDDIIFIGVLSACSHAGLVNQGRMLFDSMIEEYHLVPRIEHYACMINLLGRAGHMDEAHNLVRRMPFKPSTSILESLLGACSIHGNVEVAEEIGRTLLQRDPENSGSYVMLSRIYAAAGRWADANRVRAHMEGRGLRKVPGFSAIEMNSNSDWFLAGN